MCDEVDADENCNGTADEEDEGLVLTIWYSDSLGGALDIGGDLNGDGNDDLLIGAYSGSSSKGQVFVMFGGGF